MAWRVVVDTNVLVSAVISPRSVPARILRHFELQTFTWLISDDLFHEYVAALQYEKVRKRHNLTEAQLARFLDDLRSVTVHTTPTTKLQGVVSDPDDSKLFECALAGGAHFIVSGDAAVQTVHICQEIRILSPIMFLTMLEQNPR